MSRDQLRDYQELARDFLRKNDRSALFLDMQSDSGRPPRPSMPSSPGTYRLWWWHRSALLRARGLLRERVGGRT